MSASDDRQKADERMGKVVVGGKEKAGIRRDFISNLEADYLCAFVHLTDRGLHRRASETVLLDSFQLGDLNLLFLEELEFLCV